MCWCNNKKKIFYIFFIKETVTRDKLLCFYYLFQALVMFPEVKCYVIICSKKALFSDK